MNSIQFKRALVSSVLGTGVAACSTAGAGGIILYEVGTAEVGLASAGSAARAQDAATVLTNPAGMTRLAGDQLTLGAQILYGDVGLSVGQGTSPALGTNGGGNPAGWIPGGGLFYSHSVSPGLKVGLAVAGDFGSGVKYDAGWVGRYRAQEGTLIGVSVLPSIAWRVNESLSIGASLKAMVSKLDVKVAVNNIVGPDGSLALDNNTWGFGANVGLLYEMGPGTRFGLTYNSPVKLDFKAQPQWNDLGPGIRLLLASRGLLDATVNLGVTVPQAIMASFYHEVDPRWAVLGSAGWQQWSKFGAVELGVDSNNPVALTANLNFKDTWHLAGGLQYRWSDAWLLNAGIAYDSGWQDSGNVSLSLPVNAVWRFGVGGQKEESKTFGWGWGFSYTTHGNLHTDSTGSVPVALGGRGDVVGSFNDVKYLFFAANINWKF